MKVSELEGPDLDPYIEKAMGHIGRSEIPYHTSGEIAMRLYALHGVSLHSFADGVYATMRNGHKLSMQHGNDPITAIYRAYVVSKLGEDV